MIGDRLDTDIKEAPDANIASVWLNRDASDVTVGNGSKGTFTQTGATTYTLVVTPTAQGAVTVDVAAGAAQDAAGNGNTAATQLSITYDTVVPTVTVNQASGQIDPADTLPINFTVVFSEAINPSTFSTGDIHQNGTASGITWALSSSDNITWTLSATAVTTPGTLVPSMSASAVQDAAGNNSAASTSTDNNVTYDTMPPTVILSASPTSLYENGGQSTVTATLSKLSSNTVTVNLAFSGTATNVTDYTASSANIVINPGSLSNTMTITSVADAFVEGSETVVVDISSVTNGTESGTQQQTITILDEDTSRPSVTIDQASGQADPANTLPIHFTVTFSEPINPTTFTTADITQNGTATGITWNLSTADNITWTLSATAVTGQGTLVPSIAAGMVQDPGGNNNYASTSTDNSVTYDTTRPTITSAATMDADSDGLIDHYKITFSEAVLDSSFPGYQANSSGNPQTSWLVARYNHVVLKHGAAAPEADTANDNVIYLGFDEGGFFDTDAKPDLTTTASPGLTDLAGNTIAQVNTATVGELDRAVPIITRFHGAVGQSLAYVDFSEPIDTNGGGCTGNIRDTDFIYANDVAGGATGINTNEKTWGDRNGCDERIQINLNANITAADTTAPFDKISAAANQLFDTATLAVSSTRKVSLDPDAADADGDTVIDSVDNCVYDFNFNQSITAPNTGPQGDACAFNNHAEIRFNTTALNGGANVANPVAKFPVLVRINEAASPDGVPNIFSIVNDAYTDIRFVDGGTYPNLGPYLPYEVERWDKTNKVAEIWVYVNQVDGNSATDNIYMYYGETVQNTVSDGQNANRVFDFTAGTGNNFVGVWHMSQSPAGGAGAIKDSTPGAHNGTSAGTMTASDLVDALVGTGIDFDGVDDVIDCGTGGILNVGTNLTLEAWGYYNSTAYAWRGFVGRTGAANTADYSLDMTAGGNFRGWISNNSWDTGVAIPQQQWFHVVFTYTAGTNTPRVLYLNGASVATSNLTATINNTVSFKIGKNWDPSWLGMIDEVRISNTVRSADWIRLSYENQKSLSLGSKFIQFY
ncbi:MAG TPA: DUF2341 domain-containing protein [Spirochaetota bacterium]|nr:DUF2341 domain-containing protein [Spirochaetota bacterium]HPL18678.1 DUF2341 domain-containing protein [Spirochaetota bacterium]HQF09389.1 DUF2341 domain-containing protein [Spirochaetota bacterium]HQH97997.1 DUF2341 domain-containing protein [Spirochaetota bacterium]HQJ71112.1 DUF2341 domain-containing protein [Spirochaetota bacterium]